MKTPILGSAYVARSVNAADNQMINLFPEIIPEGGKEPAFLSRVPGLLSFHYGGSNEPIRALYAMPVGTAPGHALFYVKGLQLWMLASVTGTPTYIGNVASGTSPIYMADNGIQLFISCGGAIAYIYNTNTSTLAQITDPDFTSALTVAYLDGFFVYNEGNSQKIWVTALLDGTSVDPLDFASAEASPDDVTGLIANHGELWVFGAESTEVWYNAGNPGFPFSRIQGSYSEVGCVAPRTIDKLDNSVFWLGGDRKGQGIVYRSKGYSAERISTHAIEWQIQQYSRIDDARAYSYQQDGHAFYVLNFPTANATWVYDVATGAWHQRAYWDGADFSRHRGDCSAFYRSYDGTARVVVGDYENGQIYTYDQNTYTDNFVPQKWLRSWRALPTGANNLKRSAHHSLQLDCETGVGYEGVSNPQVTLRFSDDGGHTWSNERSVTMGSENEYGTRVIWRRLGMTTKLRDRVYEVSGTDPVKVFITGAELIVSGTNA